MCVFKQTQSQNGYYKISKYKSQITEKQINKPTPQMKKKYREMLKTKEKTELDVILLKQAVIRSGFDI